MKWKFWKKDISEPVFTLAQEIMKFDMWKYEYNQHSHYLNHKHKELNLQFVFDMYNCWVCCGAIFTQDEQFYLGNAFKEFFNEIKRKEDDVKKARHQKERLRITQELEK